MPENLRNIRIEDYNYPLDAAFIAQFPLEIRDRSKLLIYNENCISQDIFSNIASHLPADSLLVSNETRVVHARLLFRKPSGSQIEIFCLEPVEPTNEIQLAFQQTTSCTWKCLVGNAKRWKSGDLHLESEIDNMPVLLTARLAERTEASFYIQFDWTPAHLTFARILEHFGKIPLPPYISRDASENDNTRYQTVFARYDGSVAAPTAGLHFTPEVLSSLAKKNIATGTVTLHVGAGTFKPVSTDTIGNHQMHHEQVIVPVKLLRQILAYRGKHITLVGTTTVRTLESVYWQGVKWLKQNPDSPVMHVEQWDPYSDLSENPVNTEDALKCVIETIERFGHTELHGETSLMIAPGYKYHIPDAIITNFHQPKSTLLLLVAAFIGPQWKDLYNYALANNFRFLSYGDSCLFFKHEQ
ncbi:MAG TPA: S-adenosylmethionine:tRNA ribosyltransferase-isomerase [Bacteroidales bacterium]|nr:S-adenosylmethionine:tRNA ribosyltransferase-isomerase [Bacteroidales bacterium]